MKKFRIVALLLVMCLASSCFVGSTFAKYSSSTSAEDSAVIAKWQVIVDDSQITDTHTFDLFDTAWSTNGATETNTKDGCIAPGTQGSFSVSIKNESDVAMRYNVSFEQSGYTDINIQFSKDENFTDPKSSVNDLDFSEVINLNDTNEKVCTIYWRWVFDDDGETGIYDVADTTDGITAQTSCQYTVLTYVSATQVD